MTSNGLKIVALILMFVDHMGEFLPGMPIWLRWLGRLSAPTFFFCMAWGFFYTGDRKKYLLRMYCFGAGMGLLGLLCNNLVKTPYAYMTNNIFVTILLACIIIWLIENRNKKLTWAFILFQMASVGICLATDAFVSLIGAGLAVAAFLPNMVFCEGGMVFVALGVILYFAKERKQSLALTYGCFCVVYAAMSMFALRNNFGGVPIEALFTVDFQWMMIGALPLMLSYNGKKGKSMKYFFYVFYPAHILLLFMAGSFLLIL